MYSAALVWSFLMKERGWEGSKPMYDTRNIDRGTPK